MPFKPKDISDMDAMLVQMNDAVLLLLRAKLEFEMRKRKIAFSVGEVGERLVIELFNTTSRLPKLQLAPTGTKNVDALSRNGDRFSIKTVCNAKKTGTIYPDRTDKEKQLFEFLLIVRLGANWTLESVYQITWADFVTMRSWDSRMNAWYVGCSASNLKRAKEIYLINRAPAPVAESLDREIVGQDAGS